MMRAMLRRQVTAFLPPQFAIEVDSIRTRFDVEMARRIAPHITVVHDFGTAGRELTAAAAAVSLVELTGNVWSVACVASLLA